MSTEANDCLETKAFYLRNYRVPFTFEQIDAANQEKRVLTGPNPRRCRFCDQGAPSVTFRDVAHAVPESIGNRRLISEYECDACNRFFGSGIENHFGNWSKPYRLIGGRSGKKGIPTLKGGGSSGWRIERMGNRFEIVAGENEGIRPFTTSENHRVVTLDLPRDPYVPIDVLKTFVKMALSVMPEGEFAHFRETRDWLMDRKSNGDFVHMPSAEWLVATSTPADSFAIHLLTRRPEAPERVPYAFLLLSYGVQRFQINIPCPARDNPTEVEGTVELPAFPWCDAEEDLLNAGELDLAGTEWVTGDKAQVTYRFETVEVIGQDPGPAPSAGQVMDKTTRRSGDV